MRDYAGYIKALEYYGTWILTTLPPGKHAIDSKWVYRMTYTPNGEIEHCKACLVPKIFTQIKGLDFHDMFSLVAKLITVHCLLTLRIIRQWHLHQLDVNNPFLHDDLHEEIYTNLPYGFAQNGENWVYQLKKSL